MRRILRCKYLQGGHLYDQLLRDPQAPQPGTQQNRDCNKLPVRSEHRGCNAAEGGELLDAYLFVAILPHSGYAYTEAFLDMKGDTWITAHVNAYRFFGGVTRILMPDNLKTGVIKNTKDEPVVNKSYQEMAEHYGTAIVLSRPRKPKDKAFVEGSVGVVSTWILAALRNQRFLPLKELNIAIQEKLTSIRRFLVEISGIEPLTS